MRRIRLIAVVVLVGLAASGTVACGTGGEGVLTIYSGRSKELVDPLLQRFAEERGVDIEIRYGQTAEMAATIIEEGDNSPADVFYAQDAGALGALADAGRLATLTDELLDTVPAGFRSPDGLWVGTSGRARTLAYNPELVDESELPDSVLDLTDPEWNGRIAWAPPNGSFQAFVTGLRVLEGDERAREWLEGIIANDPEEYPANIPIVDAVGEGQIEVGLVNHYYTPRLTAEDPELVVRNYFFPGGDPGGLINVAGAGVLESGDDPDLAVEFVEFLLAESSQEYFATETFEYPLVDGVDPHESLPPLASLEPPEIDLSDLDDLRGTLRMLEEVGAL